MHRSWDKNAYRNYTRLIIDWKIRHQNIEIIAHAHAVRHEQVGRGSPHKVDWRDVVVALARNSYGGGVGPLPVLPQEDLLHQGKAYSGEIASRTLRHEGGSTCTGSMNRIHTVI